MLPVGAMTSFDVELDPARLKLAVGIVARAVEAENRRRVGKLIVQLFGAGLGLTAGVVLGGFLSAVLLGLVGMLLAMAVIWPVTATLGVVNRARLSDAASRDGLEPAELLQAVALCQKGQLIGYEDAINEAHRRGQKRRLRR